MLAHKQIPLSLSPPELVCEIFSSFPAEEHHFDPYNLCWDIVPNLNPEIRPPSPKEEGKIDESDDPLYPSVEIANPECSDTDAYLLYNAPNVESSPIGIPSSGSVPVNSTPMNNISSSSDQWPLFLQFTHEIHGFTASATPVKNLFSDKELRYVALWLRYYNPVIPLDVLPSFMNFYCSLGSFEKQVDSKAPKKLRKKRKKEERKQTLLFLSDDEKEPHGVRRADCAGNGLMRHQLTLTHTHTQMQALNPTPKHLFRVFLSSLETKELELLKTLKLL